MGFIATDNEYFRTPEFIKFAKKRERLQLEFVIAHVVRDSEDVRSPRHPAHFIYKEYFLKGKLVARFSQTDIAKYLGTKQSHVSERFTRLEEGGFLKKIPVCTKDTKILYYQVGTWSGELGVQDGPNAYTEHLWFHKIFDAYAEVAKQKRDEDRRYKIPSLKKMTDSIEHDEKCGGPFGQDLRGHYPKKG